MLLRSAPQQLMAVAPPLLLLLLLLPKALALPGAWLALPIELCGLQARCRVGRSSAGRLGRRAAAAVAGPVWAPCASRRQRSCVVAALPSLCAAARTLCGAGFAWAPGVLVDRGH